MPPRDVSESIASLLISNRGPVCAGSQAALEGGYGIAATLESDTLDVVLTFRCGHAYCCMEWGCHMGLEANGPWQRLRETLSRQNASLPDRFMLKLYCVVEEEAMFYDLARPDPHRKGVYALAPAKASSYDVTVVENR